MYVWYDLHILYMDYPAGVVTTHGCELFHMQIYAHLVDVPADEFRSAGEIAEFRGHWSPDKDFLGSWVNCIFPTWNLFVLYFGG